MVMECEPPDWTVCAHGGDGHLAVIGQRIVQGPQARRLYASSLVNRIRIRRMLRRLGASYNQRSCRCPRPAFVGAGTNNDRTRENPRKHMILVGSRRRRCSAVCAALPRAAHRVV